MPRYTPTGLTALVEARISSIGFRAFLREAAHQRLREMWCAARFCTGYAKNFGACEIDIADKDEYREFDFHLCEKDDRLPFQIAEVIDEGRRRGDEYKSNEFEQVAAFHNALPRRDVSYATRRVCAVLQSKLARYKSGCSTLHMLLYINLKASSVTWAGLANGTERQATSFASVWLVAQNDFCCIHSGSRWSGLVGWKLVGDAVSSFGRNFPSNQPSGATAPAPHTPADCSRPRAPGDTQP